MDKTLNYIDLHFENLDYDIKNEVEILIKNIYYIVVFEKVSLHLISYYIINNIDY